MNAASKVASVYLVAWIAFGGRSELRADESPTRSNAEVMFDACSRAMENFCADAKLPDTSAVSVSIGGGEVNAFFAPVVVQVLRQHFPALYSRRSASAFDISATVAGVSVLYGEGFSDGIFAGQRCRRTIDVELRLSVTRNDDGRVLWAGSEKASRSDTVYVSDIRGLQKSSLSISSGQEPAHSTLERLLEPLIIGGAAGVVVYLFFTIRS